MSASDKTHMDKRQEYIDKYNALKELNDGKKPLRNELLKHYHIHKLRLTKVFGKDVYL